MIMIAIITFVCTKPLSYLSVLNANDITHAIRIDIRTTTAQETAIYFFIHSNYGIGNRERELNGNLSFVAQPGQSWAIYL